MLPPPHPSTPTVGQALPQVLHRLRNWATWGSETHTIVNTKSDHREKKVLEGATPLRLVEWRKVVAGFPEEMTSRLRPK